MIKNIVFDIGNVLTYYTWEKHIHSFGFSEEICDRVAKATVKSYKWGEYDRGVLSDREVADLLVENDPEMETQIRMITDNMTGLVERADYAIPWIKEWKKKGYRVYFLSNFSSRAETDCKEALDFIPYADGGILSYQDKLIKPDPKIYELLLSRYHLKPEECVFLDDVAENVEGARKCGYFGIQFLNKEQAEQDLKKLGVE